MRTWWSGGRTEILTGLMTDATAMDACDYLTRLAFVFTAAGHPFWSTARYALVPGGRSRMVVGAFRSRRGCGALSRQRCGGLTGKNLARGGFEKPLGSELLSVIPFLLR
ncbi:hypothetical protein NBRC3257_2563 [Gluconobacter thailandicus NBRC 3257]|uniref:Uncharacterized protein n=1 Tax=Gluconobacter thailandicus NBRC 3257 TaxID=1381097 RepID=A0ABQ0IZC9_GLUTH|nr:hypothetical protein NBRC3255_2810 [Gluconobacter thailandicus NBRC 3255]GAD27564.1 hypothetical protein NBRC3257_2563 [Gluconobacter thailandicus NBRC 3257]